MTTMTTTQTDPKETAAGWVVAGPESSAAPLKMAIILGATAIVGCFLALAAGIGASRGALQLASDASAALVYGSTALVVIYGVVAVCLSFRRS